MAYPRLLSVSGGPNGDAQSLHAYLVSCTDDIVGACGAVEAFLREKPPESALGFFRLSFPVLLQKMFGFQDSGSSSSSAWLLRATDEHMTSALRSLLHPSGPLFASLIALDREQAVQFVFPNERLPLRVRRLLLLDRGVSLLSQTSELFKNRFSVSSVGGLQLQLDLFEFYIFWFAYYAASCDDYGSSQSASAIKQARPSPNRSFSHWVSGLHHTSNHGNKHTSTRYGLYLQLLHFYLTHFVQSHHFTGMVHIPGTARLSQGGFLLLTLLEFWVMKDDMWPLQATQLGAISVGFTHSGVELDAVRLIVNHSNSLLKVSLDSQHGSYEAGALVLSRSGPGFFSFPGSTLFTSPMHRFGTNTDYTSNSQLLQRPLYRFISRALLYWPAGISVKQAWYLVELWVDYMQPWIADTDDRAGSNTGSNGNHAGGGFSGFWQGYVAKNYPFYTILVVHFLNFALKYVRGNMESLLEMMAKVLGILAGSKDLLEFLRKIDHTHHTVFRKSDHGHSLFADMDWEEGISTSESKLDDQFSLHALQESAQLRLFGVSEGGAFHTFQMLILQCEAEMQFIPPDSQRTIFKALENVKHAGFEIFNPNSFSTSRTLQLEACRIPSMQNEARALGRHTCFDVKYRGDWMRRPIESTEVAFLVRFLVKLSDYINCKLKLTGHMDPQEPSTPVKKTCHGIGGPSKVRELDMTELLRASRHSIINVSLAELAKESKAFLLSCCNAFCMWLQRQGWRVNLRFLAQKPCVALMLMLFIWLLLKKL